MEDIGRESRSVGFTRQKQRYPKVALIIPAAYRVPHRLRLRPRESHDLRLESSPLEINLAFEIRWQRDVYGTSVAMVRSERSRVDEIAGSATAAQSCAPVGQGTMPMDKNRPFRLPVFPDG